MLKFDYFIILVLSKSVFSLSLDNLYPFGEDDGDIALPKSDDIASEPIKLKVPIKFFAETYDSVYVNNNGLISMLSPLEEYVSVQFPLEYLVIAPLYTNVDTRRGGNVWYRESYDPQLLEISSARISRLYPRREVFQPKALFIATWDKVSHINASKEANTFQLALSNDGTESYLELLYPDGGIQWIRTRGQGQALADAKAQAGIVAHDGRLLVLPNSGTDQIRYLDKLSNSNEAGLFVFRVGNIEENENIEEPTLQRNYYEQEPTSCAQGFTRCHSHARCENSETGFCCVCQEGYYGNGINCLIQDVAVRVSGKLNMADEAEMYLQAYLVPNEGASYIAITRVPPNLGPSLQLLEPLAATFGWLIAKPISGGVNGFQLTGGVFNSTIEVRWPGGEKLTIKSRFLGVDLVDQLRMEADISGTLPGVPIHRTLSVPDYHQELTRTGRGVLRSQTPVKILVDNTEKEKEKERGVFALTKTETIEFNENCSPITSLRLKSSRHQLVYKQGENVARFASLNKISSNIEGEDPCIEGQVKCVANSSCVVEGDSFKCVCNPGFEVISTENGADGCQDINECEEGSANCHSHAICVNEVGTFHCQCRPGYRGDGQQCIDESETQMPDFDCRQDNSCHDCPPGYTPRIYGSERRIDCVDIDECENINICGGPEKSECVNTEGGYTCLCRPGYQLFNTICEYPNTGEDDPCEDDPESCQPENGYCNNIRDISTCRCVNGWRPSITLSGKFACVDRNECAEDHPCDSNAQCFNNWGSFHCKCKHGFTGNGFSCTGLESHEEDCNNLDCGPKSHCEEDLGKAKCVCNSQYTGQHPNCMDIEEIDCFEDVDCGQNARCDQTSEYYHCVCNEGFVGTGYDCRPDSGPRQPVQGTGGERAVKTCLNGVCWCPSGYQDTGVDCIKIHQRDNMCKTQCSQYAQCVYVPQIHEHQCTCNPGYEGNGIECNELDISCELTEICDINAACTFDETSGKHICICNEGYVGDGTTCYPTDECQGVADCKMNEACVYNNEHQAFECSCADGFSHDYEGNCLPLYVPDESSETCPSECSPHATCESGRCVCQIGYRGDGFTCSSDCSQLGDCSPNADCVYHSYNYSYTCICNQGYEGDGYTCNEIRNCYTTPELCSVYASCLRTAHQTYVCTCNQGYYGNGTHCKEGTKIDAGFLLVNQGRSTQRLPLDATGERGRPIHLHKDQVPVGLATDCVEGRVYWSDIGQKSIQSSTYDGGDIQTVITTGVESSEGLAIDWLNRAIYWTDSGLDTISKADLDSKETTVIINDGLVNPRGIAVHPAKRKVYWSDWDRENPKLEFANLDGSDRSILLKGSHVVLPNSLAIDWSTDELCWADAGTKNIECFGLTSRRHRTVIKGCKYPFGLAITSDKYYWTDWVTHKIESATKTGALQTPLQLLFGGDDKLYGLAVVMETCPN